MWTFNFLALVSSIIAAGSGGIHAEENAVIIFGGGIDEGKAEAYPASCNLDLPEDTGNLCGIGATALDGSVYYCGGKTFAQGEYRKFVTRIYLVHGLKRIPCYSDGHSAP